MHSAVKARITEPVKLDLSLATCTASSFYSKAYSCMHAFDGKFGRYAEWSSAKGKAKGEWFEVVLSRHHAVPIIQVDFYTSYWASKLLHSLQYQLFCNNSHPPDEEISKAELVFDGTEKRIMAVSKDRHAKNVLKIDPPIFAKKVKVVALEMHKYVSLVETCLDFYCSPLDSQIYRQIGERARACSVDQPTRSGKAKGHMFFWLRAWSRIQMLQGHKNSLVLGISQGVVQIKGVKSKHLYEMH